MIYKPDEQTSHKKVLFVNGPPASGKSTIAEKISVHFHLPVFSLDAVKEALFDVFGIGDREYNRKFGRASMSVIWSLIEHFPDNSTFIIDSWLKNPPYDNLIKSLQTCHISHIAEIWCWAPGPILAQRYRERVSQRHPGHLGSYYADELELIADTLVPTGLGPLLSIDTSQTPKAIDMHTIFSWSKDSLLLDGD